AKPRQPTCPTQKPVPCIPRQPVPPPPPPPQPKETTTPCPTPQPVQCTTEEPDTTQYTEETPKSNGNALSYLFLLSFSIISYIVSAQ
ncbi:hypothetical protein ANCDUO_21724, partial [Ancylostoma duodenale]